MNTERFWQLVEASRRGFDPDHADGNLDRQREQLQRLLMKLPPAEVIEFRNRLFEQMNAAFRWDLWGAAYLVAGGCSDDGFTDFRSWLISMGRRAFEETLENPEALVSIAEAPGVEDVFFEEFLSVPARVHEELTGREPPAYTGPSPSSPAGTPWTEEDLPRRLPNLWARYRTPEDS